MAMNQILLFALIIMCTYFVEGLIGFGGTILAIPLASKVLGLKLTIPILNIVVFFASIVIAIRDFKFINKKQFIKITSIMAIGLPIGMWMFNVIPEKPLKIALGIFMIIIGFKGLYKDKKTNSQKEEYALDIDGGVGIATQIKPSKSKIILENVTLFLGGIVHGAFTCGGPFVVVYATQNINDKSSFRATLCALWATLNGIKLCTDAISGQLNMQIMKISLITMVFVVVAIITSNIVHKKINGENFTKFVNIALIISGILMI